MRDSSRRDVSGFAVMDRVLCFLLCLCLCLCICSDVWALPNPTKRVTMSFQETDLVSALRLLATEMGAKLLLDSTVHGRVTAEFFDLSTEGAVRVILAQQTNSYEFGLRQSGAELYLVVGSPGVLIKRQADTMTPQLPPDALRMEYLLDEALPERVFDYLRASYPNVEFTLHPTANGFYARGSRDDLLQVKREFLTGGRVPNPNPPPPLVEFLSVKNADISSMRESLTMLVPDVKFEVDTRLALIRAEGSPGAIDQVREILPELDLPPSNPRAPVTFAFKDADLVEVLKTLCREMEMEVDVYLAPKYKGSVTLNLVEVPAEEAVRQVLAGQENEYGFMFLDLGSGIKRAFVAPPDRLRKIEMAMTNASPSQPFLVPLDAVRMECSLEDAEALKVIPLLKARYPKVEFKSHPVVNGFYARGSCEDLLNIKRELPLFDRRPLRKEAPQ